MEERTKALEEFFKGHEVEIKVDMDIFVMVDNQEVAHYTPEQWVQTTPESIIKDAKIKLERTLDNLTKLLSEIKKAEWEIVKQAWRDFGNIPINDDEEIEEHFSFNGNHYEAGTDRETIWHEFDCLCPNNLVDDLMYNSGLLDN